ncbi:MAG: hypothetical protein HAW58_04630 [Candidatus Thioglobus sp.]|nr:hypothetical protein [Candidatus Thioglobus sp.]
MPATKYKILYKLLHANGALVDECWQQPLEFEIGDGQLDRCLEACVEAAEIDKLQTFLLSADEAFGSVEKSAFQVLKRADFPPDMPLKKYSVIEFKTPSGEAYAGSVEKIKGDNITVDFNHPLAGCDVSFQVQVLQKL